MSGLELLFDQEPFRNTILIYLVTTHVDNDLYKRIFPEWPSDPSELCKQFPISALRCTSRRLSKLPYPVFYSTQRQAYYPSAYYTPHSYAARDHYRMGYHPCPTPILMLKHGLYDYALRTCNAPLNVKDRLFRDTEDDVLAKLLIYFGTPDSFKILYDGPVQSQHGHLRSDPQLT